MLLRKLRQTKHHRKGTMQSHADLVPRNANLVKSEQWLSTAIYAQKVKQAYGEAYHYTIHWDPSGYDVETLVSIIFSHQAGDAGLAAYLPIQNIKPLLKSEVCEEIQALSAKNKLTRVAGFNEIRSVSNSLQAVGMPLQKFFLGQDVLWRPLQEFESREYHDGLWYIVNSRTKTKVIQLPAAFDIAKTPILVSVSDQGGINRAGLDYLTWKLGMSIHIAFDPYHRSWNDMKHALKTSKGDLFRCVLAYSLLYNVNYGPFNSKGWFDKKKQRLQELLESGSPHQEPFLSFIPFVCLERQIPEPTTSAEREALFASIADMNSIKTLGPVVKLMRFYSFFQSEKFYDGEVWCTKLLMLETDKFTVTDGTEFIRSESSLTLADRGVSDKEQLRQLKMKHGSWGLAPLLVTPASFWQKNALVEIGRPCWSAHASMCKSILTPSQFASHTIAKCQGGWKDEILELVLQGFFSVSVLKKLYPFNSTSEDIKKTRLNIHYDFLVILMGKRASSLCAQFLRPPVRYSGLLSSNPAEVKAVQDAMKADWDMLLMHEEQQLHGKYVAQLPSLDFLLGSVCRLCYLLNERDCLQGSSQAACLLKALITHFGDTLCIENTHQSAKDCLRDSRHNIRSRVHKMSAVIDSRLFQTRQTPHVAVSEVELSTVSARSLDPFVPLTKPNSHQMHRHFQDMMQHKGGDHWWPSTSNASQFEEVAAFHSLLESPATGELFQLSMLAGKPGCLIASSSKGMACIVLCKSLSGILTWAVEPMPDTEPLCYKCIPKAEALQFVHICTLDEWVEIPVQPVLHNDFGALILEVTGESLPLPLARIKNGLDLIVRDCKEVLRACKIHLPGQPSKAQVYRALIEHYVADAEEVQKALTLSSANIEKQHNQDDDDALSEYQELSELIEEDTENRNDPDIQNEKKKIKRGNRPTPRKSQSQLLMMAPSLWKPTQKLGGAEARARARAEERAGAGAGAGVVTLMLQETLPKQRLPAAEKGKPKAWLLSLHLRPCLTSPLKSCLLMPLLQHPLLKSLQSLLHLI